MGMRERKMKIGRQTDRGRQIEPERARGRETGGGE